MSKKAIIRGMGFYAPEKVLTNKDLEKIVNTSDEWITSRTGIKERRISAPHETTSYMAAQAGKKALAEAGIKASEITHLLVSTFSPDAYIPAAACTAQTHLGIAGVMSVDLGAACTGFLYGLEVTRALLALHPEAKILLSASEMVTSRTNYQDRGTCVLFGDGAGAVVVTNGEPDDGVLVQDVIVSADGALGDMLTVKGGGSAHTYKLGDPVREDFFVQMQGRDVFKHAVRTMSSVAREIIQRNNVALDEVDVIVPHQANIRILDAFARMLEFPVEKVYVNVDRYGNTSAASSAMALAEAKATGFIKPGMTVLVVSFGGGFTWGSALLRF